ncbi:MAG: hypothetical protein ABFE07_16980 [Armatimonadia bacterium]
MSEDVFPMPCGGDAWESLTLEAKLPSLGVIVTGVTTPEWGCPGCLKSELNGGKCAGACPGELFVTYDPEQEDEI